MKRKKIKSTVKKIGKILLGIVGGFVGLILLILILLCIPSLQTYFAQKAAGYLSEKMQTEVSIDKLQIDFRLNVRFENLHLNDQYGNNLISAKKGRAGLLFFRTTKKGVNIAIRPVILDSADVTLRRYAGDTALNIQFFIDFIKPAQKNDKQAIVDIQRIQLLNSRFQCRMDDTWKRDERGVWNYSDIRLNDINLKLKQLLVVGDSVTIYIDQLSAKEHSGFKLDSLNGQLIVYRQGLYCLNTRLQTENKTDLSLDLRLDYTDFKDFGDFINIVSFNSEIHEGVFNLKDLGYFAGKLQGMETMVDVKTKISGPIVDFKIKNTHVSFGQGTEFEGDASLAGLPNIEETFIDLNIKNLKATVTDLEQFQLPMQQKIPIPDIVQNLQWVKLCGHFIGLFDNFYSDMQLFTALGDGSCELMLNARSQPVSYDGKLEIENFMLGNLLKNKDLGFVSVKTQVKGEGLSVADMDLGIDAMVSAIEFKNHTVENIALTGNLLSKQFDGLVKCEDKDFHLDFIGNIDFNQEKPIYKFDLDISAINLSNLRLLRPDSNVIVSAKIKADLLGNSIDSMQGSLAIEDFVYTENEEPYSLPNIKLHIDQFGGENQHLRLNSDVLDINMRGEFTYKHAQSELQKRILTQFSNLVSFLPFSDSNRVQKIDIELKMKKEIPLLAHFFPLVTATEGLWAKLSMNENNNTLSVSVETPQLTIKDFLIDGVKINANQQSDAFDVTVDCGAFRIQKTDSVADVRDFYFHASICDNVVDFAVDAKGNDKNKVENIRIEGATGFETKNELWLKVKSGIIDWNANAFVFDSLNYVYITPQHIYIENFGLYSRDMQKSLNVKSASTDKNDHNLNFSFNQIDLGMFNLFLNPFQISLEGRATGSGKLIKTPEGWGIGSRFQLEELGFNDVFMGFLEGITVWQNQEQKLRLGATLYDDASKKDSLLSVKGYFDPLNQYIHLDGDVNSFNIKILETYLQSFASKIEGIGSGKITFSGKISEPELKGDILLKNAVLGIAFLNTEYKVSEGRLHFVDTGFIFDNIVVQDAYNGKGTVTGMITHKRLKDWGIDLRIQANNMMGMNTTAKDNKLFYGKAFATGNLTIKGKVDKLLTIGIDVTTNPLTDIVVSLDWSTTAEESNFITFVSGNKEINLTPVTNIEIPQSNLALNLKVNATPDATVRVLLDPSIGGSIVGRGGGIMEISLDENDKFSIFGKYTLAGGDFNLEYADVLTRVFKLENGSTIAWNGDPMGGIMDIRAIQNAKVSMPPADNQNENTTSAPKISVNNIIKLSGNILKPNFSFTFDLQDVDEITRSRIYNSIDTSNRQEMITQMVNILFFGMFDLTGNTAGTSTMLNNTLGYSISELVSYQVNRVVSGIIPNMDVHVTYLPGSEVANREYSMDIGGSFFNNKLTIRTSVGLVEGNENNENNQFLSDVIAEYKLTKDGSLKAKGFNVTNQDMMLYNAKYSQGVGISYSKDFDRFKDLFIRKKKKKMD